VVGFTSAIGIIMKQLEKAILRFNTLVVWLAEKLRIKSAQSMVEELEEQLLDKNNTGAQLNELKQKNFDASPYSSELGINQ